MNLPTKTLYLISIHISILKELKRVENMTNKPMTKSQLVANLAESVGSDKASANRMIDALSAIISKEVAAGGAVTLPGIGKFSCRAAQKEWLETRLLENK